jgi:hypothetical protein
MIRSGFAILFLGVQPSLVVAQAWPAIPSTRKLEVGFFAQRTHRTIYYNDRTSQDANWARPALFVRVSVTPAITLEVNGFAWHARMDERRPGSDYFRYTLGGGLTLTPFRRAVWTAGLGIHVHEHAYLDQSPLPFNLRSTQVLVCARLTRKLVIASQSTQFWVGPGYERDWFWQHPPFELPLSGSSRHDFGVLLGGSILAIRRVRLFGEVTYFNHWQSQVGLGVLL